MAHPLQKASARRKVYYFAALIGLFTLSILWRGGKFVSVPLADTARVEYTNKLRRLGSQERKNVEDRLAKGETIDEYSPVPQPAPSLVHRWADTFASRTVEAQAGPKSLDLRELDQGDPEIAGNIARLSLIGARGIIVTFLWRAAIEQQKRNEFQEFELLVRTVTQLQPNFITPWIYQSWNITYNVSVENDRLGDMYYYIARGIDLLAQGERQNKNSPDMRYQIAFYYQNKFGVSDKVTTLRSLMQLSCIPPQERKADRFRKPDGSLDAAMFQEFCRKNPQLVRRLREKVNCRRPEEVIAFLEDNAKVPTRYDTEGSLADAAKQFPVLPPKERRDEYDPKSETGDEFDAFHAARAWYEYSLTIIPPASAEPLGYYQLAGENRFKYRMPKSPALIIFRQGAPRAQTYLAERLQKEGWFDLETTWYPDERADTDEERWFPRPKDDAGKGVGLRATSGSDAEWARASERWSRHGEANGLRLDQAKLTQYQRDAQGAPQDVNLNLRSDEQLKAMGLTRTQANARVALISYEQNRYMTNFPYFLAQSEAEADRRTVEALKVLWEAEQAKSNANYGRAIELYAQGVAKWRGVLVRFPSFHRAERSDTTEDATYEQFLSLVTMLEGSQRVGDRAKGTLEATRALLPFDEERVKQDLTRSIAEEEAGYLASAADERVARRAAELKTLPADAKLTGVAFADHPKVRELIRNEFPWLGDYKSELKDDPWVSPETKRAVRERLGLARPQGPSPQNPPPTGPPIR